MVMGFQHNQLLVSTLNIEVKGHFIDSQNTEYWFFSSFENLAAFKLVSAVNWVIRRVAPGEITRLKYP